MQERAFVRLAIVSRCAWNFFRACVAVPHGALGVGLARAELSTEAAVAGEFAGELAAHVAVEQHVTGGSEEDDRGEEAIEQDEHVCGGQEEGPCDEEEGCRHLRAKDYVGLNSS